MRPERLEFDRTQDIPKCTLEIKQYYIRDPKDPYVFLARNPQCKFKSTKRVGCCGGRFVEFCLQANKIMDKGNCWSCETREV